MAQISLLYVHAPGFIADNPAGEPEGILVTLMEDFANYVKQMHGIRIQYQYHHVAENSFSQLLELTKTGTGGTMALSNTTITPARTASFDFSKPFISNIPILISHPSVPELNSLSDIGNQWAGKELLLMRGSVQEKLLTDIATEYGGDFQHRYVTNEVDIIEQVSTNPNAISSLDFMFFAGALKNKVRLKRHPVGDGEREFFGIAMPKGNDWTAVINSFLSSGYLSSTQYRKLVTEQLGSHSLSLLNDLD